MFASAFLLAACLSFICGSSAKECPVSTLRKQVHPRFYAFCGVQFRD